MKPFSLVWAGLVIALLGGQPVRAQDFIRLWGPPEIQTNGTPRVRLEFHLLNPATVARAFELPRTTRVHWEQGPTQGTTEAHLDEASGSAHGTVPAGGFVKRVCTVSPGVRGRLELWCPDLAPARVVLELPTGTPAHPTIAGTGGHSPGDGHATTDTTADPDRTAAGKDSSAETFFRRHFSGYEPLYFIAGPRSPNAKFQISFKYQILNTDGALARWAPPLTGLHLGYTQTSLWDLDTPSAPFLDSSYKPELLYRIAGIGPRSWSDWVRFDLQGGVKHESNGREGSASRSLNIVYFQPTVSVGPSEGFHLELSPRAWVYVDDLVDNPDLERYRGYADLRAKIGWTHGLQLDSFLRVGDAGDKLSYQLDASYPLSELGSKSFSLYLHAQYFTGYGESLLFYNRQESTWRFGFSLYR